MQRQDLGNPAHSRGRVGQPRPAKPGSASREPQRALRHAAGATEGRSRGSTGYPEHRLRKGFSCARASGCSIASGRTRGEGQRPQPQAEPDARRRANPAFTARHGTAVSLRGSALKSERTLSLLTQLSLCAPRREEKRI